MKKGASKESKGVRANWASNVYAATTMLTAMKMIRNGIFGGTTLNLYAKRSKYFTELISSTHSIATAQNPFCTTVKKQLLDSLSLPGMLSVSNSVCLSGGTHTRGHLNGIDNLFFAGDNEEN